MRPIAVLRIPLVVIVLLSRLAARDFDPAAARAYLAGLALRNEFSGAALIAVEGRVVFAEGHGLANREHGIPNTRETVFLIGSVSKQFTAMGILLLQEENKLKVSDPLPLHLPDCPPAWRGITIRHLLMHTSGIPNFTEFKERPDPFEILPSTAVGTMGLFKERALDFEPGTRARYSNSGYVVLSHLIERITGQAYGRFLDERIFKPLGMKHSGFYQPARLLPGRASGYSREGGDILNAVPPFTEMLQGAGALYSTVDDLLRWDEALSSNRLARPESGREMFTIGLEGFGYGWFQGRSAGRTAFQHNGSIPGFGCRVARFPAERVYIAVLGNLDWSRPDKIVEELSRLYFGAGAP